MDSLKTKSYAIKNSLLAVDYLAHARCFSMTTVQFTFDRIKIREISKSHLFDSYKTFGKSHSSSLLRDSRSANLMNVPNKM